MCVSRKAVLITIANCLCQGTEGGNTAAAGNADNVLCITKRLIGEIAERTGSRHAVAHFPIIKYIGGNNAAVYTLHGNFDFTAQCRARGRGNRIGAIVGFTVYSHGNDQILAGAEPRNARGTFCGIGCKDKALKIIAVCDNLFNL